jgi:GlcNAc-P-P-Und epimerase
VYMLALFGSGLQKIGVGFPITLSRYKSMTSDNPAPMQKTFDVLGPSTYSLDEGVQITAKWLTSFWQKNA